MIKIEERDLTLETPWGMFNHRVGCLAFHEGMILLERSPAGYWFVPGGRVSFGEFSKDAVLREIKEELSIHLNDVEWAGLLENYFTMYGKKFHEVAILYRITVPIDTLLPKIDNNGDPVFYAWHAINTLQDIDLRPYFLSDRISEFKKGITHVLHRE
jgi:8-oxo-dGTP pyrophosphatase MutT (NUDIX family)